MHVFSEILPGEVRNDTIFAILGDFQKPFSFFLFSLIVFRFWRIAKKRFSESEGGNLFLEDFFRRIYSQAFFQKKKKNIFSKQAVASDRIADRIPGAGTSTGRSF